MSHKDACTARGALTWIMLLGVWVEIIVTVVLLAFGIYLVVGLAKNKVSFKNSTGVCIICLVVAGFMQFIWEISYPITIQAYTFVWLTNVGLPVGLCFTAVFACFGMMTLSLMWLEVARASKTMKKSGVNLSKKPLIVVIVVSVLFFILMTLFWTILRDYQSGGLTAIVFLLAISISYLIGARELDQVMSSTKMGGKKSPRLLKIISTARRIFGCVIFFIVADVFYALTTPGRTRAPSATNYLHILGVLCIMASNIGIFYLAMSYIQDVTLVKRGFTRSESSKTATGTSAATTVSGNE